MESGAIVRLRRADDNIHGFPQDTPNEKDIEVAACLGHLAWIINEDKPPEIQNC